MTPIPCALIGFGRIGKIHYKNIMENEELNLKYIIDRKEVLNEIRYEVSSFIITTDSLPVALTSDIKIVFICSPTNEHHSQIIQSLNHDKHVFCEKPINENERVIKECYNLAESKNLTLLCAFNRRFDPQITSLKNKQNSIGKVHQISTFSRDYPYPSFEFLSYSSGLFSDCAIHDIDFINWILNDKPTSVYVSGSVLKPIDVGAKQLDNAIIIMEYPNNITAVINSSRISTNYDQRIEIHGENGSLISKNPYGDIDKTFTDPISFTERYKVSYSNEIEHMIDCVKNGKNPIVTKEECINNVKIIDACNASYHSASKVVVDY